MRSSDWSSDVCSSDLGNYLDAGSEGGLPFSATLGVEHCPHCGAPGNGDGRHGALRPIAAGAPFLMSQITPGLLSNLSPELSPPTPLPSEGRRLITLTDARQGTARPAANVQIASEPNPLRSEESRVGKACVSTCNYRCARFYQTKQT